MPAFSVPDLTSHALASGAISYRETGKGEPLVFLHGINIHSGIWGYQFPYFQTRYRTIAWDAPSYGGSAPREGKIEVYAAALAELLDALDIEKVRLVGHSMGGIIGGAFAGLYPERVQALVLSCTHTGAARPADEPLAERYQLRIKERNQVDPIEYGKLQAAKMTTDDAPPELAERIAAVVAETSAEYFPINAAMCQQADNRPGLARLRAPTLIVQGGADRLGPSEGHRLLLATMPEAERHVFPALGHSPYLEDPAAYNEALESFLGRR